MAARKFKINAFDISNAIFMVVFSFFILYPLWYCIVFSFNEGTDIAFNGLVYWWPREFTLINYQVLLRDNTIAKAFMVSVARTVLGTALHVFFTAMVAYAFSKRKLPARGLFLTAGTITMFFGGGMIPTYLWYRSLGLLDNFFVYIFPWMFSFFDALIFMGFFRTIPDSIEESAEIDGANDFLIFLRLILPLSTPVLATITIFHGVAQWNDFFSGFLYINKNTDLTPIQTFLYQMVVTTEAYTKIPELARQAAATSKMKITPEGIRVAVMMISTLPIMVVYPFLQKYFTKGVMLGAIKG